MTAKRWNQRDAAGYDGVEQSVADRSEPFRCRNGLRFGGPPSNLADNKPYIYRTHDGGKTWQNMVAGIPEGAYVNSVKEDTQVKGLLFACTELRVYVSFNDGNQWQPLQNNMPVTSVRDIVVHGDDLAVATHGRGFWVLDQMTPLRQIAAAGIAPSRQPALTSSSLARRSRSVPAA